jgi:hypothetical protein
MTAVDGGRSRVAGERNLAFVMIWIIGGSSSYDDDDHLQESRRMAASR